MEIIQETSYFLNLSPKREQFLKDVEILFDVDTTKEKLMDAIDRYYNCLCIRENER